MGIFLSGYGMGWGSRDLGRNVGNCLIIESERIFATGEGDSSRGGS
jgi:hypothetical protein